MADYKSKFTGEQIDALLDKVDSGAISNNYFYEVDLNLLKKIDNAEEPLTIKEAISLYNAAITSFRVVFHFEKIRYGGTTVFFYLNDSASRGDSQSPDNPDGIVYFSLISAYVYCNNDGELEMTMEHVLNFTYEDGYFVVTT